MDSLGHQLCRVSSLDERSGTRTPKQPGLVDSIRQPAAAIARRGVYRNNINFNKTLMITGIHCYQVVFATALRAFLVQLKDTQTDAGASK